VHSSAAKKKTAERAALVGAITNTGAMPRLRRSAAAVISALTLITGGLGAAVAQAAPPLTAAPGVVILHSDKTRCTLGYAASNREGERLAVTAGHCGADRIGQPVYDRYHRTLGHYIAARPDQLSKREYGYALIALHPAARVSSHITPAFALTRQAHGSAGDEVCIIGTTSGVRCSTIATITDTFGVVRPALTTAGDSGGPVVRMSDRAIIGIHIGHNPDADTSSFQPVLDIINRSRADNTAGTDLGPYIT